jgi:predicted Zn-dependent peptidase
LITKHTCSNGIRVVLETIPTVRSVTIGVWIGTGSRYETEATNGISHFIEHMLFKGTSTRSAREIAEAFDKVGGQVNAFTSKEYTCLYAKVLDEHASYAVDVLADMLFHSVFDPEELNREKQVIYEEIKMYEDTPDDRVHDLLSEATYGHHPLGFPILGTEATLSEFDATKLREYIATHYLPEEIVVSIAGNVDESILPLIDQVFCSYQAQKTTLPDQQPQFFTGKIGRKKETEQAHLCLGFNGLPVGDDDLYRLTVMNNILGGSMSSRLFQEVREERGLAYSIFSFHTAYKDSGLLTIYGGTGADQLQKLYDTIFITLDELVKKGVTENELINSKEQLKGNMMLSLESTSSRMSRNAKNELLLGRHRPLDELTQLIDQVTLGEVKDLANRLFTSDFSCSIISPSGTMPNNLHH